MNEIVKICKKHGELKNNDLIKTGKSKKGDQRYRCKKCMEYLHKNNYKNNKDKILSKIKEYRLLNKEKVKEWKRSYFEKYKERDKDKKRLSDHKLYQKNKEKLTDSYIKHILTRRTSLTCNDIPKSLIEFKKVLIRLKLKLKYLKNKG